MFINGCPANSTMFDDNDLVQKILQVLRFNQRQGTLTFPACLIDLPKHFPGCAIQSTSLIDCTVPFTDKGFKRIGFNPDNLDIMIEVFRRMMIVTPENMTDYTLKQNDKL